MDKKGMAWKDDNWWRGAAEKVVHRNYIKESLSYEDSLRCSPTHSSIFNLPTNTTADACWFLLQSDTGVVDSGATHLYISPQIRMALPTQVLHKLM